MSQESTAESRVPLSERQAAVLRAVVGGYVGGVAPMGSGTVSHLLPMKISSASIRATMAELTEQGLLEKCHASSGRVPTERGLRVFVDQLLGPAELGGYLRRSLDRCFAGVAADGAVELASRLLSDHTRQLGFVLAPRLELLVLRHVSLVRVSSERLLVVLVSEAGQAHQRVIEHPGAGDQVELDRIAQVLNRRIAGHTLDEIRSALRRDLLALRHEANRLMRRALDLGMRALAPLPAEPADLVIATRLALLDQPEFQNPERIREVFEAIETGESLTDVLDGLLGEDVRVAIGEELDEPGLRHCAVVLAPYGGEVPPLGALGVIGPSRMDYGRIIPLVDYCSRLVTDKLTS